MPGPKRSSKREDRENSAADASYNAEQARYHCDCVAEAIPDIPENKEIREAWAAASVILCEVQKKISQLAL